jgi:tetratricopeptide (TPR) repeat protein
MNISSDKNWSIPIYYLALVTLVVFYQVHSFAFVNFDDTIYVSKNLNIQAGITLKTIKWALTAGYAYNWHPLTWLSHMLDWQFFGPNPAGHHLVNLAFHIANTLLLFVILKQMTHRLWPSAFVAALFALHPLHVESVAWVSERKDVLSTFFWMLTVWAYVRFVGRPKIANYLLIVVFLALGLMAKPMLVTLPFVLLLLDYWPLDRFGPKDGKAGSKRSLSYLLIEKVPLFAIVLASCIITFIVQKESGAMRTIETCSFPIRFANASISYVQYIIKMIWPARLAVFYPHPGHNVSVLYAVISAVFLLAITILVLRFARNHKYLVTGWFWYLGTLIPVIGIVQVGDQAMADRYSYVTLTGLFIIIAWGLPELLEIWPYQTRPTNRKTVLWVSSLIVLSALAVCTYLQVGYWKDTITLCQHALNVTENNYGAHFGMTEMLLKQGRVDEAIWHNTEAVRIKPDHIEAINALGFALYCKGKVDEAIGYYKRVIEINPRHFGANFNLGIALAAKGRFAEAVKPYEEALRIQPQNAIAHNALGIVLLRQGKFDEAIAHFNQAVQINPGYAVAKKNLNLALDKKQKSQNKNNENAEK